MNDESRTRIDDLLTRMTLEEKAAQLAGCIPGVFIGADGVLPDEIRAHLPHGIGHISNMGLFGQKTPVVLARTVNEIQRYLVEETRLGIPGMFHNEALSGVIAPGFTAFPAPSALAASFAPDLVEEMSEIIGRQMRGLGFRQALSPVMDVARDARWGRFHETYGEDVALVSAMSVAFTRGLQGRDLRDGVIATAKHFLAYSATEAGQNMGASVVGPRELYDVHATPFEAAIQLAGLASVMNSYSEIDGVPVGGSREILTDLLRGRLGFTGSVVSDYHTVGFLHERNRVAEDYSEAGRLALEAGVDVELPLPVGFGERLVAQVRSGDVSMDTLDTAVRRVLEAKDAVGLFDHPYADEDPIVLQELSASGRDLSRDLARRSVTLLTNDGILPLDAARIRRIAVVGPHADDPTAGFPNYTYPAIVKMLQDILDDSDASIAGTESVDELFPPIAKEQHARELAPIFHEGIDTYIRREYGALGVAEAVATLLPHAEVVVERGTGVTPDEPVDGFDRAVAAARDADVVILALGGRASASGAYITEGEGHDTADIDLPANQRRLVQAVSETGTPSVAVLAMGRPYGLAEVLPRVSAAVTTYYAGPDAARASVDAIFGLANPAGRLPFTLPRSSGQVPIHYAQKVGSGYRRTSQDMHHGYLDLPTTPLLPFGHGLSYTRFDYSEPVPATLHVPTDGVVEVSIRVRNVGERAGDEVVQLYVSDTAPGVTRPMQQLAAFRRLHLEAGQEATVSFAVPVSQLGYTGADHVFAIDPGPIELLVGASSDDIRGRAHIDLVGPRRALPLGVRTYIADTHISSNQKDASNA